ncbi:hypothetical protein FS837_009726 [Tulasnella sp. UAMH 9824]|nr:hypothetical protein FS837_009726 [Tulasnella sp. UAMH 9824]
MDRLSPPPSQEHRPLLVPSSGTRFPSNTITDMLCNFGGWVSRRIHVLGIRGVVITLVVSALTNFLIFSGEVTIRHRPSPNSLSHDAHFDTDSIAADWGRVTGPVADGRIVVTGGGGNIGKHMIRRLLASSTPVTVIDKIFHEDELDDIYSDVPQARDLLRVKLGDIRDSDAMKEVMTDDVVGVIHLAAISRVLWCLENQKDCWDVNERGTEVVLEALADLNRRDKGKRWFVLASSREVYGDAKVFPVLENSEKFDLIHIDDVVDAFLLAVQQLTHRRTEWSFKSPSTFFDAFNVASGSSAPVDDLIDKIVRYTRSKSPIQYIHGDARFPNVYRGSTDKAWTKLGFRAAVSVEEGVLRLVKLYLQRTERVLQKKIDAECGPSAPNLRDNADLPKLNNCQAHVDMDVQGELTILGSPDDVNDNRWHAGTTLPPYPVRTFVKYDASGRPLLAVREKDQDYFFGIRHSPTPKEGPIKVERIWRNDIAAGDYVDWEMEVNAEEGTMKLILPGFPLQLKPPASPGGNFYLVPSELEIWPFRVTPICCPAPPPWPFFRDDPVSFQMEYQRTSLVRPFLASPIKTLCDRFSRARRKIQRDLATLSLETLNEQRRKESSLAPKWVNANLPACSNSCDHPTICVDTGDCQCVLSSCSALQRFPFSAYANLPVLSYPPIQVNTTPDDDPTFNPLIDMVARSSWLNVLRPQASRFVGTKTPFPKLHVGELHQEDADWRKTTTEGKTLHLLRDAHCFSADTSMEHAIAAMEVSQKDADYVFVPHWQSRAWYDDRLYRSYNYSRDNNPYFDPYRVVIPFTHDWGACMAFEWNVWDMRKTKGSEVSPYVRSTTSWTVMADHNSPCYRPHQDVVIPPRTCVSPKLYEAFGDMSKVKPVRDRSVLATFKGTPWDVERMQANIMLVRDAFVYPLDNASPAEVKKRMLDQRGPLWFALHSTRMRMLTRWPMDDVYDRP